MLSQPTRYPLHHLARLPVLTTLLIFLAVGLARAPVAYAATCAPNDGRRRRQWLTAGRNVTIDGTGHTSSSMVPASSTTCFRVFDFAGGNVTLNRHNISKRYMTVGNDQKPLAI